jgi:hypothetical protein
VFGVGGDSIWFCMCVCFFLGVCSPVAMPMTATAMVMFMEKQGRDYVQRKSHGADYQNDLGVGDMFYGDETSYGLEKDG